MTLVLLFHPDLAQSRTNAALATAAARLPGVDVVDMQALYPTGHIDTDTEVARLIGADQIVLQFPVQWYSTPPLLQTWQCAVLTRMFYIAYENEGRRLEGRPLMIAATAGGSPDAYSPSGVSLFPLAELLRPLRATASRCALRWAEPFLVYEAGGLDDAALELAGRRYARRLSLWREQVEADRAAELARRRRA
jgi:putative NADPH-quinone reductase